MHLLRVRMFSSGAGLSAAALLLSAVAGLAGCPRATVLDEQLDVTGPVVIGERLAYLDRTRERVTLLAPLSEEVRHVELGRRPSFMMPSPDHSRLHILTKGWLATAPGEINEEARLFVIDPASGDSDVFVLESPFDRVTVSTDNRYAITFFAADAAPGEGEVFRNPNSVAIIDLDAGEVRAKNVRSFGDVPIGVLFSPPSMAPLVAGGGRGSERTLAVVLAPQHLTLLDVTAPDRREVTVRLTLPGSNAAVVPDRLVFVPEAGALYLQAKGSNDIFVLTLTERTPANDSENDFVVSINTLAAGAAPADLLPFEDGGRRKILVANQGSRDLTVIDGITSEFFTLPVGAPVDRVLGYPAEDPSIALVFSQATRGRSLHLVALNDIETLRGGAVTTLDAAVAIANVALVPGQPRALVMHDNAGTALSVLELDDGTLSPVAGGGALLDFALTPDGSSLAGTVDGRRDRLGIVDLDTISARALVLDRHASDVLALHTTDDDSGGRRTVIVVHDDALGRVTVVPDATEASADDLFVLSGFLLEGLLDERFGETP